MSYPHIDPKTYLKLLEHDIAKPAKYFGHPPMYRGGSQAAAIRDMLRSLLMSARIGMRAVLQVTKSSN